MKLNILLSSTSFIDTPGYHHHLLNSIDSDIIFERGPLNEKKMLEIIDDFDALLCGDDEITYEVIKKGSKIKLKYISKYGTGLDKINVHAVKKYNIQLRNCPGVNQTTVAEHVFALLLSYKKNIFAHINSTKNSNWNRKTGTELKGKTIGVVGAGNIGKEVIKRAQAFGMKVVAFDKKIDTNFAEKFGIEYFQDLDSLISISDIISLHLSLNENTFNLINKNTLMNAKEGVIIVNTARANLINLADLVQFLKIGKVGAYLTDVLETEPMVKNHQLLSFENVIITPHVGSRTKENVVNQGTLAVNNLIEMLKN